MIWLVQLMYNFNPRFHLLHEIEIMNTKDKKQKNSHMYITYSAEVYEQLETVQYYFSSLPTAPNKNGLKINQSLHY